MKRIAAVLLLLLTACAYDYSSGERAGQVVKFSRKGLVNKSWEGQINLGGMKQTTDANGNASVVANVFEFSVDGSQPNFAQIRAAIDSATESGQRVKVWYRQSAFANPMRFDTGYLLDSARIVR